MSKPNKSIVDFLFSSPDKFPKIPRGYALKLFLTLSLIIVALAVTLITQIFFANNFKGSDEEIKIRINTGDNFTDVINILEENGILKNTMSFKIAGKLTSKDEIVLPGKYIFKKPLNNRELLNLLTDPSLVQMVTFRVPEGITLRRLSQLVENHLEIPKEIFLKACSDSTMIADLGLSGKVKNLEGFLFPDTYRISINIHEDDLVKLLVDSFKKRVTDNNSTKDILSNPDKLLSTVTMASIIEGETYIKDEMPVVSGVYHNRIRKRMRLEADPTVQYALPDGPKNRLLYEDLRIDSPYNTYRNFGLPPGPINSPGLHAILAALNPDSHEYLFFVATGDGGHTFTETYSQHLDAVRVYRERMRQNKKD